MIDFYKGNTIYFNKKLYTVLIDTNITKKKYLNEEYIYAKIIVGEGDVFLVTIQLPSVIDLEDICSYDCLIKELIRYRAIKEYEPIGDRIITCTDLKTAVEAL
jgi:hypothetical protein